MAIFGKMTDLQKQFKNIKGLDVVFDYLNQAITSNTEINARIHALNCGQYEKIEIKSDVSAVEQSYETRKHDESLFESHIKYIDFQFMLSGEEAIEVVHTDLLDVDSEYNDEGDYTLYKATSNSSKIIMRSGDCAIFFPADGHMPGIQSGEGLVLVRKTVVKVPLALVGNGY